MKNASFALDEIIEMNGFYEPLPLEAAYARFEKINTNPANAYRSGYERYMALMPKIIRHDDPNKQLKLEATEAIFNHLASVLADQSWISDNWPADDKIITRTVLAIDKETGSQLLLARWNVYDLPIHGHAPGQAIDFLIKGSASAIEYEIVDAGKRLVVQKSPEVLYDEMSVLMNEYNTSDDTSHAAFIHKFIPRTKCITLHLVPELPRDGHGNLFTETSLENHV